MNTILFTWNPRKWEWNDLPQAVVEANLYGRFVERWSCGITRHISPGDRAFLMRLGVSPKGLMGSGVVLTTPEEGPHWDIQQAANGDTAFYVYVLFDVLNEIPLIAEDLLSSPELAVENWYPQASGTFIRPQVAEKLEEHWTEITGTSFTPIPKKDLSSLCIEGTRRTRLVTEYERNAEAREKCIAHHGARCQVCGLAFEERYGAIGKGFIHVHHLVPMSKIGKEYRFDPIRDLCPVCPNCHAMLHKRPIPYTVEDLRQKIHDSDRTAKSVI
ncbi:MAG TPA: HNH endonuclease [bacterium]|nr:HNH endonuclease [bacterium]